MKEQTIFNQVILGINALMIVITSGIMIDVKSKIRLINIIILLIQIILFGFVLICLYKIQENEKR